MTDLPITEPGVYDMDADRYHADPVEGGSLSSSGARKLLPPGCPAQYAYERDNPPGPTRHYDIGHAWHKLVLGNGPDLTHIPFDTYRTKAAQTLRDDAHEDGHVPLLNAEWDMVHDMAAALREHPDVGSLFDLDTCITEAVLVWRHNLGWDHIWRRAMLDLVPHDRTKVVDIKSAAAVDLASLERAVYNHGYYAQADYYLSGAVELGLVDPDAEFWFVAQAKEPPYLVTPFRLDDAALSAGRALNHEAMNIYAECVRSGVWPGHATGVETLSLPRWAARPEVADW